MSNSIQDQIAKLVNRRNEIADELGAAERRRDAVAAEIAAAVLAGKDPKNLLRQKAELEDALDAQRAAVTAANEQITQLNLDILEEQREAAEAEFRALAQEILKTTKRLAAGLVQFAADVESARKAFARLDQIASLYRIQKYAFLDSVHAAGLDAYKWFLAFAPLRKLEGFRRRFDGVPELLDAAAEK